jgi:hypothetical protein
MARSAATSAAAPKPPLRRRKLDAIVVGEPARTVGATVAGILAVVATPVTILIGLGQLMP